MLFFVGMLCIIEKITLVELLDLMTSQDSVKWEKWKRKKQKSLRRSAPSQEPLYPETAGGTLLVLNQTLHQMLGLQSGIQVSRRVELHSSVSLQMDCSGCCKTWMSTSV